MNITRYARKLKLIIVAVMIGVSNVIYEEDKMIDSSVTKTEMKQDDKEPHNRRK